MAEEETQDEKPPAGGNKMMMIILIVVVLLLLVGIGVGLMLYLKSDAEPVTNEAGEAEEQVAEPEVPLGPPVYIKIHPAFTVNFSDESTATFLQVEVQVMTRDTEVEEGLKTHMPRVKNDLLLLFRSRNYEEVNSSAGQRKLSQDALATIQKTLEDSGAQSAVEAVYFTSFVMQ